jgi:SAM-dependent methyltransferase
MIRNKLLQLARQAVPREVRERLLMRTERWRRWPPPGMVRMGNLRRVTPISRVWGFDRGLPVDRYYIDRFLQQHTADVQGRVLEIADNNYTCRFGGQQVAQSDVLHVCEGNPQATIIGDLTDGNGIPDNAFDCVILTQTIHLIYDVRGVIATLCRILKPGGVALVTTPGISQISRYDMDNWGCYWNFTSQAARRLFEEKFAPDCVTIDTYGNVLAATAFLYGLSATELRPFELDYHDRDYEIIIGVRAEKPEGER